MSLSEIKTDFLVIGSGISGLMFALHAAQNHQVTLITKKELSDCNTNVAQGGLAAVLDPLDLVSSHINDTIRVGDGLCVREVVEFFVEYAPSVVREMVESYGVQFDTVPTDPSSFELGMEGGHSARRIVHYKDITGKAIEQALIKAVLCNKNITVKPYHMAVDLLMSRQYGLDDTCFGAYVLNKATQKIQPMVAQKGTVLATGGLGKVYLYTSNPDVATGDGVAMAYRAGAKVANMEFVQFHPTCLYHPQAKSFLISETVRGEGGVLTLKNGQSFMEKYHPMKSLAPRDVVCRAIDSELKQTGDDCVFIDITHRGKDFLKERFPSIYKECERWGIDMASQPIPVVPAAHYSCGGIQASPTGVTSIPGLYALGETAMTGFHGACRLASNSLLEGAVMGKYAAMEKSFHKVQIPARIDPWYHTEAMVRKEAVTISQNWDEIRRLMWNYAGIVKTDEWLNRAQKKIRLIQEEVSDYYRKFRPTTDFLELRNIVLIAQLIVDSALERKESRGLHWNLDYPETKKEFEKNTILSIKSM